MAITEVAGGAQACTVGTEHTLTTDTSNGTFVLVVDTQPLVNADVLELRLKTIVRAAGTERGAFLVSYINAQDADEYIKYSVPVPANISIKATMKQVAGTSRTLTWALLKL